MDLVSKIILFFVLSFVFLLACSEQDSVEEFDSKEVTIFPRTVISSDSYLNMEYCFGAISDVGFLSNQNIGILDRMSAALYIFSPLGEYVMTIGRKGSAPGEFNNPDSFEAVSGDSIWVFDRTVRKISVFDNSGSYLGEIENIENAGFPYYPDHTGDNSFVGGIMGFNQLDDDNAQLEYVICSIDRTLSPLDTLFYNSLPFIVGDLTNTINGTIFSCAFTGDLRGNVFISQTSTDNYVINGYNNMGEQITLIEKSIEPLRKTSEALEIEYERFNRMFNARNSGSSQEFLPNQYYYMIPPQGLHADNLSRIWALDGHSIVPKFDVYDYSGQYLSSVVLEGIDENETIDLLFWKISDEGILAFSVDPYENASVYVYDMPEDLGN